MKTISILHKMTKSNFKVNGKPLRKVEHISANQRPGLTSGISFRTKGIHFVEDIKIFLPVSVY